MYYSSKVESLKGSNPRCWWKEVRKLSGSVKSNDSDVMRRLYVPDYENMNPDEISNSINAALLEPLQSYTPLDVSVPPNQLTKIPLSSSKSQVFVCVTTYGI